jgi:hypothetical protein
LVHPLSPPHCCGAFGARFDLNATQSSMTIQAAGRLVRIVLMFIGLAKSADTEPNDSEVLE